MIHTAAPATALLATVERDGFDESFHHGTAVLLAPDGTVLATVGDVDAPMLPRSVLKPLFAAGMVDAGLDLAEHELALASGSVVGDALQLETARTMAARLGVAESDLRCTPRRPRGEAAASAWGSACIGKHVAQVAASRLPGLVPGDEAADVPYTDPAHPLQLRLRDVVASLTGVASVATATDGCGAPVFTTSLLGLARAVRRLQAGDDHELSPTMLAIGSAMRARPELVDGAGEPDTELMRVLDCTAKYGAEGTQVLVAADGTTAVVEVADGARRAGVAAAVALLEQSGAIGAGSAEAHEEAFGLSVHGGGRRVGRVRAAI